MTAFQPGSHAYEALIAERAELRADNARLRADNARLNELFALKWDATQSSETEAVRAENARLRLTALKTPASRKLLDITKGYLDNVEADNERLRTALQQIMGRYELEEEGWPAAEDMREIARRALEPKP